MFCVVAGLIVTMNCYQNAKLQRSEYLTVLNVGMLIRLDHIAQQSTWCLYVHNSMTSHWLCVCLYLNVFKALYSLVQSHYDLQRGRTVLVGLLQLC